MVYQNDLSEIILMRFSLLKKYLVDQRSDKLYIVAVKDDSKYFIYFISLKTNVIDFDINKS